MPFGLANAPTTFHNMMNDIYQHMIDHIVVIYLDNILIYTKNEADDIALVKRVLSHLQEYKLAIVSRDVLGGSGKHPREVRCKVQCVA